MRAIPTYAQIREAMLVSMQGINPNIATDSDSDYWIRATGEASAIEGLYQHQSWIARQIFPDTADAQALEQHCALRGIYRKAALAATGTLRVTGSAGTFITGGTQVNDKTGLAYQTTAAATIATSGSVDIPAAALVAGSGANQPDHTVVTLISPPDGIEASALLVSMGNGTGAESDAALLARYLDVIRYPSAGGNRFDWRRWALEVPGVTEAFVFDNRRGAGTVDVAVLSADGLPSTPLLDAVRAHIDQVRPLGLRGWGVYAPTPVVTPVNATVSLNGTRGLDDIKNDFVAGLTAYFFSRPPGGIVYLSRLRAILAEIDGVTDSAILTPTANIVPAVTELTIQWATLGAISVTAQ